MESQKRSYTTWLVTLILSGLIVAVTLFGEWFGIEFLGDAYNATLFKAARFIEELGDLFVGNAKSVSGSFVLVYFLLVTMAVCCIITLRSLFIARTNGGAISNALFVSAIILASLVILIIASVNLGISNATDGWIDEGLKLTAVPFIVLACGIAGCVLCHRYSIGDVSAPASTAKAPDAGKLFCPNCKKATVDGEFCSTCGTRLIPAPHTCPQCGKPIAPNTAFCSHCGYKIAE